MKGNKFNLNQLSGVSDVNIASTLGLERYADSYLDSKLFNYSGKVSSKLRGMNPVAQKILSPLANQTINAMSKPLRGLTSMFDNTVTGAVNGVGQAASNSVTTGINSVIDGVSPSVNAGVKSIGEVYIVNYFSNSLTFFSSKVCIRIWIISKSPFRSVNIRIVM